MYTAAACLLLRVSRVHRVTIPTTSKAIINLRHIFSVTCGRIQNMFRSLENHGKNGTEPPANSDVSAGFFAPATPASRAFCLWRHWVTSQRAPGSLRRRESADTAAAPAAASRSQSWTSCPARDSQRRNLKGKNYKGDTTMQKCIVLHWTSFAPINCEHRTFLFGSANAFTDELKVE